MKLKLVVYLFAYVCVCFAQLIPYPVTDVSKSTRKPIELTKGFQKHLGGFIVQPNTLKGHVVFAYVGSPEGIDTLAKVMRGVGVIYHLDAREKKLDVDISATTASATLKSMGVNAAVFLVEDPALPTLLSAPENAWAIVNVTALKADNPDTKKLLARIEKELWRAFALVCGSSVSSASGCVLNAVSSLADVDGLGTTMISMEPSTSMEIFTKKIGIAPYRRTTYRQACREGWAPPPTNEYQTAIWQKMKDEAMNANDPSARWKRDFGDKKIPRKMRGDFLNMGGGTS